MSLSRRLVVLTFKVVTRLLCRIDASQLKRVPDKGPLIIVTNHVNFLEIPILYAQLQPRPVVGMVLARRWEEPLMRWLLNVCGALPLRRGEADVAAVRMGLELLSGGNILVIAPEGTRSGHGQLQKAHPGAVLLALRSGAPLVPVVFHGSENYRDDWRRLRRTEFHVAVGQPFHLDTAGARASRPVREQMITEVMYQMAALLPAPYRGFYSDLDAVSTAFLSFD